MVSPIDWPGHSAAAASAKELKVVLKGRCHHEKEKRLKDVVITLIVAQLLF